MSRRFLAILSAGALLSAAGWAVGQQGGSETKKPAGEPGRFTVAPAGNTAVLLDTHTGQSWLLQPAGEAGAAWVPTRRFDTEKEVRAWLDAQRAPKTAPLPNPSSPPGSPKLPRLESLQYQVARIRAALEELDVRKKSLDRERENLFRQQEELERQIKLESGEKKRPK